MGGRAENRRRKVPKRDLAWWFWLAVDLLLATSLLVDRRLLVAVIAIAAVQVPIFARGTAASFPAQVRIAYLGLLVIGLWPPAGFIHWVQLVGTTAMVLFGYCFLARCLSLLPLNRTEPMSAALLARTFFTLPVAGSIATGPARAAVPTDQC
jgi:hypothetical protein